MTTAYQLKKVRDQLTHITKQVADGQLYESLPKELNQLIAKLPRHRRTAAKVPTEADDDEMFKTLAPLVEELNANSLKHVTNDQLGVIERSITSVDAQIRDQCGLTLINGLLANRLLSSTQLLNLTAYCQHDTVMFGHILEPTNRAAFGRAYAVMTLSGLLYADRVGQTFIDDDLLAGIIERVAMYTLLEHDTRGIVDKSGWIHAFAAIGSVMNQLAASTRIVRSTKLLLMALVLQRYATLTTPLITDEQETIATFLIALVNMHELYHRYLKLQLTDWHSQLKNASENDLYSSAYWTQVFNYRRLTAALVMRESLPEDLARLILKDN